LKITILLNSRFIHFWFDPLWPQAHLIDCILQELELWLNK